VTTFRLSAGRPATLWGGGSSAPLAEETVEIEKPKPWFPNREPDTLLKCGCWIPWPIVSLLGNQKDGKHGDVHCDIHGWQAVAEKEKARARKGMKQCRNTNPNQSTLPDIPPF
jgi:hypothetical protein